MLSIYRAGEIDLFENLDIVHIRLLVEGSHCLASHFPGSDRLRVGWLNGFSLGGVPPEQKMLKGHLPRVICHEVY